MGRVHGDDLTHGDRVRGVTGGERATGGFNGSAQTVPASGSVSCNWYEETKGTGGVATVTCSFKGATKTGQATFSVVNA
jgi:hypothetical protein